MARTQMYVCMFVFINVCVYACMYVYVAYVCNVRMYVCMLM